MAGAVPLLPLHTLMAQTGTNLPLNYIHMSSEKI